jgi:hypothetical protein
MYIFHIKYKGVSIDLGEKGICWKKDRKYNEPNL